MSTSDGDDHPTIGAADTIATEYDVEHGVSSSELPAPGYQLGEVLGRGGMGEVVLAEDLRIGRRVAFKRMQSADPASVARFWREARIQARLDHPAIVPVHELGL